ncbi:hypothetical protein AAFF_G00175500 [Aldrovandia affinis]|uniref:Ig-like domain-containing protein n=1 Tax=Aldrovandia affinis TaxID=143900 RepID=A0AAD7RLE1_9TELE|nr:hypothetical protein AAFF_G00175500 [Aldrovandia affinis]
MSPLGTLTVLKLSLLLYYAPRLAAVRVDSTPQADGGSIIVQPEDTVSLTCLVEEDELEKELQWFRDGGLVRLEEGNRLNHSSLCISPVSKNDNRVTFTCQLKEDACANNSVQLDVRFPPELSGTEAVATEEDSDVVLTCDIHANPQVTVSWLQDGGELDMEIGGYVLSQDGMKAQLSIANVKRSLHEGTYTCMATSSEHGNRTKSFELTVGDKTMKFPLGPIIAGLVVVFCTAVLAFLSRWKRIVQAPARVRGLWEWSGEIRQIQTEKEKFGVTGSWKAYAIKSRSSRLLIRMSSMMVHGVESAVSAVWRAHTVLDESEEGDSSPEAPDRFRKLRSSTSLNSLRMSLRRRLPLRPVQPNVGENPTWESLELNQKPSAVRLLTRSARNSIGTAYQKLQRIRAPQEECLVATPGKAAECEENGRAARTPRKPAVRSANVAATVTPKRRPLRTPKSATRRTPRANRTPKSGGSCQAVRPGNSRRQLVRMAALRSPFASPNTLNNRRKFDRDLESVSSGLRKLKRLSQAFDEVIGRDDRVQTMERYRRVVERSYGAATHNDRMTRASIRCRTRRLRDTVGSWTDVALSNIRKAA